MKASTSEKPGFGHSPAILSFWRELAESLLERRATSTPLYLFSVVPLQTALDELITTFAGLPVRHWLSCKTQPLAPLLQWWKKQRRPIEVVSEFEFLAALKEGFAPENILLNGPAKHSWLPRHAIPGLRVNFDSVAEAKALLPLAQKHQWSCGVRLLTSEEFDPETPPYPTQFGLVADEAVPLLKRLLKAGVRMDTVHFHLRTNVAEPAIYQRALEEAARLCQEAGFRPRHVDCGGGFPPPHVLNRQGKPVAERFSVAGMREVYEETFRRFPSAQEIWLENGRWLSARSGALLVQVLDSKERRGMRHLICNGGRTLNGLVSTWEDHELLVLPRRTGPCCLTTVSGPTCMAFDQLTRRPLPRSIRAGDHLLWLEAGAYHLPWETRFSHGLAPVYWHNGKDLQKVRARQTFEQWWGQWQR